MKILVCISHVPDTTSRICFVEDNKKFDSTDIQYIINPYDELGLTRALQLNEQLGGGTITVINVGTKASEPTLRKALAIGASDAIRIDAEATDGIFVAKQIAEAVKDSAYDFIITGKESIDYNGTQVGEMLAAFLDIPSISSVSELKIEGKKAILTREIDGGKEIVESNMPFLVTGQKGIALEPRIPSMRGIMQARRKKLVVVKPVDFQQNTELIVHELPPAKAACKLVAPDQVDELVRLLHEEAKVI